MAFRYSTPLIIPEVSDAKDRVTQQEITYLFHALRTLALQLDSLTGGLSPLPDTWPEVSANTTILGNNINKFYCEVGVNIPYGAMVNFYNLTPTTVQARPAQADDYTSAACGFCINPAGFSVGDWGEFVVGPGINYGISGMTPGQWYFLDPASALGQVTATQPVTPGEIIQLCGVAIRDDALLVGALNNWLII